MFSTLDGLGGGDVTATVGDVTGVQSFFVQPRQFRTAAVLGSATTEAARFATRGTSTSVQLEPSQWMRVPVSPTAPWACLIGR